MSTQAEIVAKDLLDIQAITLSPDNLGQRTALANLY